MVSPLDVLFFFSGFVSAGLSFSIAYLMLVSYRAVRSEYLVAFPIGFSLLGLSSLFVGAPYVLSMPSGPSGWLQLSLGVCGFAFLAATYFLKKRSISWVHIGKLQILSVLVLFGVALGLVIAYDLSVQWQLVVEPFLHILNLAFLAYVIYSLNQALRSEVELSSVVLGFTFLVIEQWSLLLWSFDRAFTWALLFAQFVGIAGLIVLLAFIVKGFRRE